MDPFRKSVPYVPPPPILYSQFSRDRPFTESHLQAIAQHKSRKSNYHLAWESVTVGRDLNANIVQSDNLSIIVKLTRRKADGVHELVVAISHGLYFS